VAVASVDRADPGPASLLRLLLVAPYTLALAVLLPPVAPRIVAIVTVTTWIVLRALPRVRSASHDPRHRMLASAALTTTGLVLFALDLPVAGPLVMGAGIATWAWAASATATGQIVPAMQVAIVVGALAAIVGWEYLRRSGAGAVAAPFHTVTVLAAVSVLAASMVLGRATRRRSSTAAIVSAVALGLVGAGLGASGVVGVVRSTTGDAAGRYEHLPPAERICYKGRCRDIVPDPAPMPSFSPLPDITVPTFQPPELPDLDGAGLP
jgi:hypothetical protein